MKSTVKEMPSRSNIPGWLDGVQMSGQDREIAQAYLRKTEAAIDLIWLAGAKIRAVFAHGSAKRTPAGTGLKGHKPVAVHQP